MRRLPGTIEGNWQASDELLQGFGKRRSTPRRKYAEFVAEGIGQGKCPELVDGGLIGSSGRARVKRQPKSKLPLKSAERILEDGDFVASALEQADEELEGRTRYRQQRVTFRYPVQRVADYFSVEVDIAF